MTIARILRDKGAVVHTIPDSMGLIEAARVLDRHRIGAIVAVDATGQVSGVLSERDIVRQLARVGVASMEAPVASIMSRGVITVAPGESVNSALSRMTDRRIRHLPVVERGQLVGIVSIGDLVKHKIAEAEAEAAAMKDYLHAGG